MNNIIDIVNVIEARRNSLALYIQLVPNDRRSSDNNMRDLQMLSEVLQIIKDPVYLHQIAEIYHVPIQDGNNYEYSRDQKRDQETR